MSPGKNCTPTPINTINDEASSSPTSHYHSDFAMWGTSEAGTSEGAPFGGKSRLEITYTNPQDADDPGGGGGTSHPRLLGLYK